jgi:hypothetical protein
MTTDHLKDRAEHLGDLAMDLEADLTGAAELPTDLRDKLAVALDRAIEVLEPLGEKVSEWGATNKQPTLPISQGRAWRPERIDQD